MPFDEVMDLVDEYGSAVRNWSQFCAENDDYSSKESLRLDEKADDAYDALCSAIESLFENHKADAKLTE